MTFVSFKDVGGNRVAVNPATVCLVQEAGVNTLIHFPRLYVEVDSHYDEVMSRLRFSK